MTLQQELDEQQAKTRAWAQGGDDPFPGPWQQKEDFWRREMESLQVAGQQKTNEPLP